MSYPQSHPKHCEDDSSRINWAIDNDLAAKLDEIDPVNHPVHYTHGVIEPIDVIESWNLNFALGSALKYICRCDHKGKRLEDLQKAAWYLNREIERERKLCE